MAKPKYTTTPDGRRVKARQVPWATQQRMMRQDEARRLAWTVQHQADEDAALKSEPCPCAFCTCGDPAAGKGIR